MSDLTEVYSPPSSAEPPPLPQMVKKSWTGWWTLLWGACVIIAWLVLQGGILVAVFYSDGYSLDPNQARLDMENLQYDGDVLGAITLISAIIICPLCFLFGHIKKGWSGWEYLGFKKVSILQILLWTGITFLMGLAFSLLSPYVGLDEPPEFMRRAAQSTQYPLLFILGVALGAPFIEEFIFRGLLFRGWRDSKMGPCLTILLTSLMWTALHGQYGFIVLTWLFLLGIIIGYARQKTGSIWTPIIMHAFNNTLASIEILHLIE